MADDVKRPKMFEVWERDVQDEDDLLDWIDRANDFMNKQAGEITALKEKVRIFEIDRPALAICEREYRPYIQQLEVEKAQQAGKIARLKKIAKQESETIRRLDNIRYHFEEHHRTEFDRLTDQLERREEARAALAEKAQPEEKT